MATGGRGRAGAWLASVGAHVLFGLGLLLLPDRAKTPRYRGRPIAVELLVFEQDPPAPEEPAEGAWEAMDSSAEHPESQPDQGTTPSSHRSKTTAKARRGEPPANDVGPEPSGGLSKPADQAGLALSGLRGATSPHGPVPEGPVTSRIAPRPAPAKPIPPRGTLGPKAHPGRRTDPRTLEEAGFRKRKDGTFKKGTISSPFVAIVQPDGRVRFRDRLVTVNGTSIRPNLLPAQKLAGEEQLRGMKTKLLRQTADLRMQMARAWSKKQLRTQLAALSAQLKTMWEREAWTTQRRRKQLFLLWDECVETLGTNPGTELESALDEARAEAGRKARSMIVRFIRDELPSGSVDGYPAAELRTLNGIRTSRQRFSPYASR